MCESLLKTSAYWYGSMWVLFCSENSCKDDWDTLLSCLGDNCTDDWGNEYKFCGTHGEGGGSHCSETSASS